MLADTRANRLLIRAIILWLQYIGPFCFAYTVCNAIQYWPDLLLDTTWRIYAAAESVFFLFFAWYARRLQHEAVHPPLRNRQQRKALFKKIRAEIHNPASFLSGWFKGAKIEDIGREEVKRFINWAFWEGRATGEKDDVEVEEYIQKIEQMMPEPFQQGWGRAKSLRLTMDPIVMEPRSLFWYGLMMFVDTLSFVLFLRAGFQYHCTLTTSLAVFPPRPGTLLSPRQKSASTKLSYWLRPHTSTSRLPIVYFHGIGIGLLPHAGFLHELDTALNKTTEEDDQVGILAVEILQVSSRLTTPIIRRAELLSELNKILDTHGWDRFVLASHSYGSILSTHILTDPDFSARVSSTLLVDPVSILLHMPDVAYNFTVRPPKRANEWELWYFASTDPGVAHTLGRHFFWSENLLWRDHIMHLIQKKRMRCTVSMASDDLIVDTNSVGTYLAEHSIPDPILTRTRSGGRTQMELRPPVEKDEWKRRKWQGKGLDLLWWPGHDHAQVFDRSEDRAALVNILTEYSRSR